MPAIADEPLFQGLRVLDLSQGIAGPYCGDILQRQGAEVIKVEPPAGDWARNMGTTRDGFSAVVLAYNAGKSGLCVDASVDAGRSVLQTLARHVDVVVQNFRPGVVQRLGLDYETLAVYNQRLVYMSISGFGADGPLVDAPATDSVLQAMSGMMHANRSASGQPQKVGLYIADIAAAIYAAQLVSAALYRRSITGKGRHLQLSLLEACAALQASNIMDAVFSSGLPATAATAPSGVFACRDGCVTLSTLDNAMFSRLCDALGKGHLAANERFSSNKLRLENASAINAEVANTLKGDALLFWLAKLGAADVLHSQVHTYESLLSHPQVIHAGIFSSMDMAGLPSLPQVRNPGCTAGDQGDSVPRLGEHSVEVLGRFGFGQEEIDALIARKAVVQAQP
ncbi:MAG: CoA transferase [Pseudomonadota bacterium]